MWPQQWPLSSTTHHEELQSPRPPCMSLRARSFPLCSPPSARACARGVQCCCAPAKRRTTESHAQRAIATPIVETRLHTVVSIPRARRYCSSPPTHPTTHHHRCHRCYCCYYHLLILIRRLLIQPASWCSDDLGWTTTWISIVSCLLRYSLERFGVSKRWII